MKVVSNEDINEAEVYNKKLSAIISDSGRAQGAAHPPHEMYSMKSSDMPIK